VDHGDGDSRVALRGFGHGRVAQGKRRLEGRLVARGWHFRQARSCAAGKAAISVGPALGVVAMLRLIRLVQGVADHKIFEIGGLAGDHELHPIAEARPFDERPDAGARRYRPNYSTVGADQKRAGAGEDMIARDVLIRQEDPEEITRLPRRESRAGFAAGTGDIGLGPRYRYAEGASAIHARGGDRHAALIDHDKRAGGAEILRLGDRAADELPRVTQAELRSTIKLHDHLLRHSLVDDLS